MFATLLSQSNLGILYNIFVCLFVAGTGVVVAVNFFYKSVYFSLRDKYYMRFLGFAWLSIGGMWFLNAVRLYFALNKLETWDRNLFYAVLIFFAVQIFFFLMYLLSVLFNKSYLSPFLIFISLLISSVFLFFIVIEDIAITGMTYWGSTWILPLSAQYVLVYSIIAPCLALAFIIFLREIIYLIFDRYDKYNKKTLFNMIPLGMYFVGILPDLMGLLEGWITVVIRTFFIIAAFISYLIFSAYEEEYHDINIIKEEKYFQKNLVKYPIVMKAGIFVFFTTLIPLGVVLALTYFSFIYILNKIDPTSVSVYSHFLRSQIIIVGVLISSMTFFVTLVMARMISVRLRRVYKGTREISRENFEYVIGKIGGKSEISVMGDLFNKMSDYLKRYRQQVEDYSQTLEQQVIDRTAELEEKTKEAKRLASLHQDLFNRLKARTDIIMQNMGDGILVLEKDNIINNVNTIFLEKFGLEEEEIIGRRLEDIPVLASYKEFNEMISNLHDNKLEVLDYKLNLRKPLRGTLECRLSPYEKESGEIGTIIVLRESYQPWGTVYDSTDMDPIKLAVVRLFDEKTGQVIDTEVTDPNGRFGFFVNPGSYHVTVMKDGYHFPARDPAGYHGEVITVESREEGAIKFDILMDPIITEEEFKTEDESEEQPDGEEKPKKDPNVDKLGKKALKEEVGQGVLQTVDELTEKFMQEAGPSVNKE